MPEKKDHEKPEIFFLPPLRMLLSFFDKDARRKKTEQTHEEEKESKEKTVEKLIEKLNKKDE
ncbi:MAG: hypothetical protein CNIPEHKO_01253 [Anaerolineales bacterium]|mgnify:CR=1 FL=1|jgi:hypothetical protein|nr:hypothetical protein [Anaerolineae bacterium]MBL8107333.1 hypothetical protein [Anaerolineales bacterium]MBV6400958.1 hypothetical protein [Anaerolineales bacterium]MCC7189478.1 hypothetical protein [Anaerolineales bacterium]HQU36053.1 hypothetical protein [Anaerolineales bacterium]